MRNRRDQATYWLGTVRERATPRLSFVSDDSLMIKYCFSSNTASLLTEFSQHFLKWWFSNYQMCLLCLLVKMQIPVEISQPCSVVPGGPIPSVHSQFPSCSFLSPFPLSFYFDIKTIHKVAGALHFSELHSQASGLKHRMWPVRLSFLAQSSLASGLGYLQLFSPWSLSDWSTPTLTSWASSCCNSNPRKKSPPVSWFWMTSLP